MGKKLSFKVLQQLRTERLAVVCPITGALQEDIFVDKVKNDKRTRIQYNGYCKMSVKLNTVLQRYKMSATAQAFFLNILATMHTTNSIDWEFVSDHSTRHVQKYRAELKSVGLIDKVKLGNHAFWYVNPFIAHKNKTVDNRLIEAFREPFERMTNDQVETIEV